MTFTPEQIKMLEAKLDSSNVKPPPTGKYGSYVEGWHVIAEANRIFGFDGWSYTINDMTITNATESSGMFHVGYLVTVTAMAGTVHRQDVGHGQGHSRSEGDAHDSAAKEAVTDALKRSLRSFGWPFGLALYDKTQENVEKAAPPPKQPEPSVVDRLIKAIETKKTFEALSEWLRTQKVADAIEGLSEGDRASVDAAIVQKEGSF